MGITTSGMAEDGRDMKIMYQIMAIISKKDEDLTLAGFHDRNLTPKSSKIT